MIATQPLLHYDGDIYVCIASNGVSPATTRIEIGGS